MVYRNESKYTIVSLSLLEVSFSWKSITFRYTPWSKHIPEMFYHPLGLRGKRPFRIPHIPNLQKGFAAVDGQRLDVILGVGLMHKFQPQTAYVGVQQQVRSALATLAQFANNTTDAETLEGKKVTLAGSGAASDALSTVTVSMSDVNMTTIGTTYRKDYEKNTVERSSFSVDFGGLTIADVAIAENELVSAGAEYQTAADCGRNDPAYMFTYGLFGTINAEGNNTITISNLTIEDVNVNLNGAGNSIGGTTAYNTVSDMAGVVVGYTQGNVTLKNITVRGAVGGAISGYDGVSALVGRAYGTSRSESDSIERSLTIEDCAVYDLAVNGQRRAAGFVGYAGRNINMVVNNSSLNNVAIYSERNDTQYAKNMYVGVFGHFDKSATLSISDVTLNNVTCDAKCRENTNAAYIDIEDIVNESNKSFIATTYYLMTDSAYLPLVFAGGSIGSADLITMEFGGSYGLRIVSGGSTYTLKSSMVTNEFSSTLAKGNITGTWFDVTAA